MDETIEQENADKVTATEAEATPKKKKRDGLKKVRNLGKGFFADFKTFISKGNVLQLAIAFIMGLAFNAIVTSLVNDVIMQFIAAIFGKADFSELVFHVNATPIFIGKFLMAAINFLLIAFSLFIIVKISVAIKNGTKKLRGIKDPEPEAPAETMEDIMKDIRELLKHQD